MARLSKPDSRRRDDQPSNSIDCIEIYTGYGGRTGIQSIPVCSAEGRRRTGQDFAQARLWYEKAAAKEQPLAQTNLGVMYQIGQGVPQDSGKAREWYQKAADNGYAPASARLRALQPLVE